MADIPVLFARPETTKAGGRLALWMHFLGGSKEAMVPFLLRLAEAGVTAVSFDAWQHGQRTNEPLDQLMTRAFGQFRRNVWPILGHTTLDAMRVLDWAVDRNCDRARPADGLRAVDVRSSRPDDPPGIIRSGACYHLPAGWK